MKQIKQVFKARVLSFLDFETLTSALTVLDYLVIHWPVSTHVKKKSGMRYVPFTHGFTSLWPHVIYCFPNISRSHSWCCHTNHLVLQSQQKFKRTRLQHCAIIYLSVGRNISLRIKICFFFFQ